VKQAEDNHTIDLIDATTPKLKAGRKPLPAAEVIDVPFAAEAAQQASQAATAISLRETEIAERYGDGLPYQRERVVHEAQFYLAQSAEAMLEAGKRLIQIKENEPHGEFVQIVEQQLGLASRSAQRMMQASVKYLSPRLASKASPMTLLGRSKLFDLMNESDDDIEALAEGGTLAGHTLQEFEHMTRRELQAALRDHKQQLQAKDKVLADRNAKIDGLEEKLHKPFRPSKNSIARTAVEKEHLDELRTAMQSADLAFARLAVVVSTIVNDSESEAIVKAANDALGFLVTRIRDISNVNNLVLDTSDEAFGLKPDWA
jgi:hypothetical protein